MIRTGVIISRSMSITMVIMGVVLVLAIKLVGQLW